MTTTERYLETPEVEEYKGHDKIVTADPNNVRLETYNVYADSDRLKGVQEIHIGVAEPTSHKPESVILVPASYSDGVWDEFQRFRLAAIANGTDCRVVGLDVPGMGGLKADRGNEMSERNLEQLKEGRAQDLAGSYWNALEQAGVLKDDAGDNLNVMMWLHSQGTFTGAEMIAAAPAGLEISDVYISEPMALRQRRIGAIALDFMGRGGKENPEYYASNERPDITENLGGLRNFARRNVVQRESHLGMLNAMARARHFDIMDQVFEDDKGILVPGKTTIHAVRASEGLVDEEDHQRLIAQVKAHGLDVREEKLNRVFHGWMNSLRMVLAQTDHLSATKSDTKK